MILGYAIRKWSRREFVKWICWDKRQFGGNWWLIVKHLSWRRKVKTYICFVFCTQLVQLQILLVLWLTKWTSIRLESTTRSRRRILRGRHRPLFVYRRWRKIGWRRSSLAGQSRTSTAVMSPSTILTFWPVVPQLCESLTVVDMSSLSHTLPRAGSGSCGFLLE